ncbi:putative bifunctional diguanylate cyclase/phosphodiesterase [Novosphingobium sp.]|uniref:putative bifunctional diguanylate cyclase/phosphodiesterase n=1 Tax=Novosphingobium sp. TaxID=1874826 RepID=UPI003568AA4D
MLDETHPAHGRYEQMLANSATAAICAGPDNIIISWNSAAEKLFGFSADDAIGQPLSIIIPKKQRSAHAAGITRAAESGTARLAGRSVEILALHANGTEIPVDLSLSMWTENGQRMFGALLRDITDRKTAHDRLEHLAHCDLLTSLPNRNALQAKLTAAAGSVPLALMLLDLDGFKLVNDTLGHSVGDQLLTDVGARIKQAVGRDGYVARLGGDEFAVMTVNCVHPLYVDQITTRIFESLQSPFELAGQSIFIGTSIGIAMSPADGTTPEQLLSSADLALYSAKGDGGRVRRFFAKAMQSRTERRHRLGSELRHALARQQFELRYQPQVCLKDGHLAGVEALLRWRHPDHGLLAPQTFISILEESAIAEDVGDWIIDQACAAAANWKEAGLGSLRVGVNLFPVQLRSGRLYDVIRNALARHGLGAEAFEVEITENTVLRHDEEATATLQRLKNFGIAIAFDDFGTGFASLSLLQKYPLDRLKIDKSFIRNIDREESDAAIVKAVIGMAQTLGLKVIAEGVETAAQEAALKSLHCHEVQGYLYGRPMLAREITEAFIDQPFRKYGNDR